MKNKYLTEKERYQIESYLKAGLSVLKIATLLNRSRSTIYREIKQGTVEFLNSDLTKKKVYVADTGQLVTDERQANKGRNLKIGNDWAFVRFVEKMVLKFHCSPSATLYFAKSKNFNTDICTKTLYNYINQGIFLNIKRHDLPMPRKKKKQKRQQKRIARNHALHTSIEERPGHIRRRDSFGHWELDSVESGKGDKACLFVMTERVTRKELIFLSKEKTSKCLIKTLDRLERKLTAKTFRKTFKTITVDNGAEFLNQEGMEQSCINKKLPRTKIYYCHPFRACERGSNENANKFIRRWIPKGAHISNYTKEEIKAIEYWVNNYPRPQFGNLSALEYEKLLE